jgi:hypothetical protein
VSFWMTRYRKLSGSKLSRGTRIRFMRWVLATGNTIHKFRVCFFVPVLDRIESSAFIFHQGGNYR